MRNQTLLSKLLLMLIPFLLLFFCGANWYQVRVQRVIDGDTIVGDVELDFNIVLKDQRLRFAGYDAWELREPGGVSARDDLKILLKDGCEVSPLTPKNGSRDDFGRLLVRARTQTVDVEDWMRQHGHHKNDQ